MNQIVNRLKSMITKTTITMKYYTSNEQRQEIHELGSDNINVYSNYNDSLYGVLLNFDKMEIESATVPIKQNIDENILDLGIVIDELVNLIFKETNEGKKKEVRNQHILDHIDNHKIILQEFYNWLLNDQNDSNSTYLLGYFNYHGIGTIVNKQKAFGLYQKAANMENSMAQYNLALMYKNGKGVGKDVDQAIYWYNKSAENGEQVAQRNLTKLQDK